MNKTSENTTYLIDNKKNRCQHNKLHPLTARRGKWISEVLYRDSENIIKIIHVNISLQRVENIYLIRNGLIVILIMICIVDQIVLNYCVWRLKRKKLLLRN